MRPIDPIEPIESNRNIKAFISKILKGCGCLSIGFTLFIVIIAVAFGDDEQVEDPKPKTQDTTVVITPPLEGDPMKELDELVGLQSVKEEIHSLANLVEVQQRRKQQGLKNSKMAYHLVFTGNPGTGKTTVARIVAGIYKQLGILKKGHLVETDRSGLVAGYVGQTAIKTNELVDSALNGVLFIDEAYSLVTSGSGGGQDAYGNEAISTLLKRMEDDRDSLVVIIAGYTNEMKRFIDSNPGLQSRFNRYIEFPDFSADELFQMFCNNMKKSDYTFGPGAEEYVKEKLKRVVATKDRNFGNGRYVRNLFEKSIQKQANRVASMRNASKKELTEITVDDLR